MTTNTNEFPALTADGALQLALAQAKGCYQRNLLLGYEALSGAGLKGKANKWAMVYARSRANLLARCRVEAICFEECLTRSGKRVLVFGSEAERVAAWTDEVKEWARNWPTNDYPRARRLGEIAIEIERASFRGDEAGATAAADVAVAALEALRAVYAAHVGPQQVVAVLAKHAA
jgi:hypothetical protein